jgi:hypothetical protein
VDGNGRETFCGAISSCIGVSEDSHEKKGSRHTKQLSRIILDANSDLMLQRGAQVTNIRKQLLAKIFGPNKGDVSN